MRVVFYGTPEFSVPSLKAIVKAGYDVAAVVTAPDRKSGRGMKVVPSAVKVAALELGLKVLQPTNLKAADFIDDLKQLRADIQVVIAFRMLPEVVWNMPPHGTVNLHASLLPNYRGAAPINWAIINGEQKTGLTTFRLKHEIDTGDILLQKEMTIDATDDAGTLHDKMMEAGAPLVVETLDGLKSERIQPKPQNPRSDSKPAPKIFKNTCIIDWSKSGFDIVNLIRGLSPYPAARTTINDKILKVYQAVYESNASEYNPGSYTSDGKTYIKYHCKDGYISLLDVQLEGKRRLKVEEFLRGTSLN